MYCSPGQRRLAPDPGSYWTTSHGNHSSKSSIKKNALDNDEIKLTMCLLSLLKISPTEVSSQHISLVFFVYLPESLTVSLG